MLLLFRVEGDRVQRPVILILDSLEDGVKDEVLLLPLSVLQLLVLLSGGEGAEGVPGLRVEGEDGQPGAGTGQDFPGVDSS